MSVVAGTDPFAKWEAVYDKCGPGQKPCWCDTCKATVIRTFLKTGDTLSCGHKYSTVGNATKP